MLKHETVVFTPIKCTFLLCLLLRKELGFGIWHARIAPPYCKNIRKCTQSIYYHTVQVWRLNSCRSFFV